MPLSKRASTRGTRPRSRAQLASEPSRSSGAAGIADLASVLCVRALTMSPRFSRCSKGLWREPYPESRMLLPSTVLSRLQARLSASATRHFLAACIGCGVWLGSGELKTVWISHWTNSSAESQLLASSSASSSFAEGLVWRKSSSASENGRRFVSFHTPTLWSPKKTSSTWLSGIDLHDFWLVLRRAGHQTFREMRARQIPCGLQDGSRGCKFVIWDFFAA
mmetsp:Transcript_21268/g.41490  ORF Transcript_21268/g.41490 Transcript_21268/m.41490 type:complete len:221 (+) Transcript_21268:859-1521(+)